MTSAVDVDRVATEQRTSLTSSSRDGRVLICCATLAASSHNTQPWRFRIGPEAITLVADDTRRCPVVDPDDAHLFKSLGCAVENLVQAATAQGLAADVRFNPTRAVRTGDGLAGRCTGNPSLPTPLGRMLAPSVIRDQPQPVAADAANIQRSAGVAVFATSGDDKPAWIEAGRASQRFAQLAIRFGHGDLAPSSVRRAIDDVIEPHTDISEPTVAPRAVRVWQRRAAPERRRASPRQRLRTA